MTTHNWKLRLATLLLSLGSVGLVQAAELDPVPVILVDEVEVTATPDPVCSVCAIIVRSKDETSTATVTITHDADFKGDVELVAWLDSDERVSVWIPAITLGGGDELEIEIDAGDDWGWDDVRFAWTRLHRAP
jgi:hypothetical protein